MSELRIGGFAQAIEQVRSGWRRARADGLRVKWLLPNGWRRVYELGPIGDLVYLRWSFNVSDPTPTHESPVTLRGYLMQALRESNRRRPVSFYLLFAIIAVLILGSQIVYVKDDPKRFALFLSLSFLFFFVVAYRAVVDFFEIVRNHFRERETAFRSTLGDEEFVKELGRRVTKSQDE